MCSDRRAHVLVWKGKAEVVEHHAQPLRSAERSFVRPHVIRLLQYVRVPRAVKRRISRRALFARDGWKCVYCGTAGGRLTLDHVIPRSKGGDSVWENVVTACAPCNLRKGDRLLEEVSMSLPRPPEHRHRCSSFAWPRSACRTAGISTCPRSSSSAPRPPDRRPNGARDDAAFAVGAVGAEDPQLRCQVAHLLQGRGDLGIERVAAEDGVEAVAEGPRRDRSRDEQVEVDRVA